VVEAADAVTDRASGAATAAIRAVVSGAVQDVGFRDATVSRARELGVRGWVRHGEQGTVQVHAEGPQRAVDELVAFLHAGPQRARVVAVAIEPAKVEGHEQFAIRGVVAGVFVAQEHAANGRHFDLRLEVDGVMRSWAVPKGPSLDPAVKRLAVEVGERSKAHNTFEGPLGSGRVIVWDRGTYEQGGRVAWPEALGRGHAVFVLHGEKLRGGFALQRTRPGPEPQWLLIKRRDEYARPGSDIVAERRESVLSGRTLEETLE
jgi:DNA ligase D-like protein (predicted 3'-phosphoesterase)